ncbi:MAG: hypothetical protein AAB971_02505, partial [Patescibacteria group bacterium]
MSSPNQVTGFRPELTRELYADDPGNLIPFIQAAYGEAYQADTVEKYLYTSRLIVLRNKAAELAGAAVIDKHRIVMTAPSVDREKFGSRMALKLRLLQQSREDGRARWATVGLNYPKVEGVYRQS